jgi:D-3-phosphoglycerate dehydrogenase / 2-oxoglutarate reductase
MSILVTARFDPAQLARLEASAGRVRRAGYGVTGQKLPPGELSAQLEGVEVLVVEYEEITEAVLAAAPSLRLLACCRNEPAASVDVDAASARGIPVVFPPGRNAISVAEYTLGLMLAVSRRIAEAHVRLRHTRELTAAGGAQREVTSEWSLEPGSPFTQLQGPELFGRTAGLVGFGLIGREIARRCLAFGMEIVAFDPYMSPEAFAQIGAHRAGLHETAAAADFLVLAAKLTPDSTGVVSADVIAAMKPSAFFVNTARAALADYDALVEALRDGRLAGAALDVYPLEPLPPDSPLLELSNVVLSPHLAGASIDVPRHHSGQIVDDLLRALDGERPRHLLDPDVWDRRR